MVSEREKSVLLRFNLLPEEDVLIKKQKKRIVLAMMILGEAGGESFQGKIAVGCVAKNRVRHPRWPNGWIEVLTRYKQFQGLMSVEEFYERLDRMVGLDNWIECVIAAQLVIEGYPDVTEGSVFFIDYTATDPLPYFLGWRRLRVKIGNLFFFGSK